LTDYEDHKFISEIFEFVTLFSHMIKVDSINDRLHQIAVKVSQEGVKYQRDKFEVSSNKIHADVIKSKKSDSSLRRST
jgi:hypothetical protein